MSPARRNTPVLRESVTSLSRPMKNGPLKPPISAAAKKMPAAAPIRRCPIPGVSIRTRVSRVMKGLRATVDMIRAEIKPGPTRKVSRPAVTALTMRRSPMARARWPLLASLGISSRPIAPAPVAAAVLGRCRVYRHFNGLSTYPSLVGVDVLSKEMYSLGAYVGNCGERIPWI